VRETKGYYFKSRSEGVVPEAEEEEKNLRGRLMVGLRAEKKRGKSWGEGGLV
jgi:hypothetical protein